VGDTQSIVSRCYLGGLTYIEIPPLRPVLGPDEESPVPSEQNSSILGVSARANDETLEILDSASRRLSSLSKL